MRTGKKRPKKKKEKKKEKKKKKKRVRVEREWEEILGGPNDPGFGGQ